LATFMGGYNYGNGWELCLMWHLIGKPIFEFSYYGLLFEATFNLYPGMAGIVL